MRRRLKNIFKRARAKFRKKPVAIHHEPEIGWKDSEWRPAPEPEPVKSGKPKPVTGKSETVTVSKFAFNTDGSGSKYSHLSNSHQSRTATGIGNGGEILGFTLPLNEDLKTLRALDTEKPIEKNRAAILEFVENGNTYRVLAVANDTGGRWGKNRYDRQWGELGVNTWDALKGLGAKVKLKKNVLSTPEGMKLTYHFLPDKVRTVEEYRALKDKLQQEGLIT